jgi:hypothetical protein
MYLRRNQRTVDGQTCEYWTLVESVRTAKGPRQVVVATLGKLPGSDEDLRAGWEDPDALLSGQRPSRQMELGFLRQRRARYIVGTAKRDLRHFGAAAPAGWVRVERTILTKQAEGTPRQRSSGNALGYFERNVARMQYGTFRRKGYFIGSGVVEAGCRSVIGGRCKQSGMRWSEAGPRTCSPSAASITDAGSTSSETPPRPARRPQRCPSSSQPDWRILSCTHSLVSPPFCRRFQLTGVYKGRPCLK